MKRIRAFGAFWYDFVVGDDWRVALAVVIALAVTIGVGHLTGSAPWWLLVLSVAVVLPASIFRVTRIKT